MDHIERSVPIVFRLAQFANGYRVNSFSAGNVGRLP
jgi:hypothetical protein